ncbi:MAG: ABC transporter ATP-binding protein [Actinomycetota bacterium]|nr:ABC transporter ATP-binding protein [Actinomycetota bacterium]
MADDARPSDPPVLDARNLAASFGPTVALRDASLIVEPGELVAVMGPSGSGKSTLLHCVAGLIRPEQGEVWFEGFELSAMADAARSHVRLTRMGLVFQFGELVPELSLVENVGLPLWLAGTRRRDAFDRARELLDRFDVADLADRRPAEVSGGQQQRVAVARALATRPAILLADEPTGALDTVNAQLVLESLIGAARDEGTAVVLVTHETRLASYCDREVVLRDGTTADAVTAAA